MLLCVARYHIFYDYCYYWKYVEKLFTSIALKLKSLNSKKKFFNILLYVDILSIVMLYIVYKLDHEFKWLCDLWLVSLNM